jgi:hypothetical protein
MTITHDLYIFNKTPVFISYNSFKQNNKISKELRFYTIEILEAMNLKKNNNLVCIGGESYLYGLTNNNYLKISHYTNSQSIYNDVILNNKIYKKIMINKLIDYNNYKYIKNGDILILNNAKLNINLLKIINNRYYKYLIIINCHHLEFWKRIKYLNNYILLERKHFITNNYFVSVNILKYKYQIPKFISLGNTCTVANQLNKLGLRNNSYPFDWCKINLDQLNKVLENNFKNYSNIKIKKYSTNHKYFKSDNINGSYILTNEYNIEFAHELYTNNIQDLENLKKKIDLRINRFIKLKNKKIIFIIFDLINKNQLIKLINNLKKYFSIFKILYININYNSDIKPNNSKNNFINNYNIEVSNKYNFIKTITIDHNYIDWTDWSHSKLDWFNIIFNN